MNLSFQLAVRNLFRNKKRTLLTLSLIACSVAAMMVMHGFIEGMKTSMVSSATRLFPGDGQIHKGDYHLTRNEELIFKPNMILSRLQDNANVASVTTRVYQNAMVSSSRHATNVLLVGIEPEGESHLSKVKQAIIEGAFLPKNDARSADVLLGYRLAKELDVRLGDRIVLSAPKINLDSDGVGKDSTISEQGTEISQGLFRVSGIVKFNAQRMDKSWVFVSLARAQSLLAIPNYVHEIALNLTGNANAHAVSSLPVDSVAIRYWPELMPELASMLAMTDTSLLIMGSILFVIAALGIINTLFMSIYERMWEFAVIKAMGNTPFEIFLMIMAEAGLLGVLGVLLGIVLGSIGNVWLAVVGIDYSNMEFSGAAIVEPIRPEIDVIQYLHIPIISLLLVFVAALYPARFASHILPARALHKSL